MAWSPKPNTFSESHIASLNRYTPRNPKTTQHLTWCQRFGVQGLPKSQIRAHKNSRFWGVCWFGTGTISWNLITGEIVNERKRITGFGHGVASRWLRGGYGLLMWGPKGRKAGLKGHQLGFYFRRSLRFLSWISLCSLIYLSLSSSRLVQREQTHSIASICLCSHIERP